MYTVSRDLRTSDRVDLESAVEAFHTSRRVQERCRTISAAAATYLELEHTASMGHGYVARVDIPADTVIAYYAGCIRPRQVAPRSNHVMALGEILGLQLEIEGGLTATEIARPGAMHLVNHACKVQGPTSVPGPNCESRHEMFEDDLGLWVLRSSRIITQGERISFDYGGTFWSTGSPGQAPRGYKLVRCRCAWPCPQGRWRWETGPRSSPLTCTLTALPKDGASSHGLAPGTMPAAADRSHAPRTSPGLATPNDSTS